MKNITVSDLEPNSHVNKITLLLLLICFLLNYNLIAQVKIGDNPATINGSSLVEMESTTQGMLIPRMTIAQRDAIASPATALMIYQTDSTEGFYHYNGTHWLTLLSDSLRYRTGGRKLNVVGKGTGSTKTTTIKFDNIVGEQFDILDELYFDVSDPIDYAGGDLTIIVDFISMGAETGKTVRWEIDYTVLGASGVVSGSSGILDSGDLPLDPTQYTVQSVTFTIPVAALMNAQAVHFKLVRVNIGAGSDPGADPSVLHCNVRYTSVR